MNKILFLIIAGLLCLLAYREHIHKIQIEQVRIDTIQETSDDLLQACESRLDEFMNQF